ncbi:MAG: hypothetical protein R3E01_18125 [Pirellulaceae bacterium]|nr:hypothetical protein [Planctomycetales bacterium]
MSHHVGSFDPYHQWLGIRDSQRPPNHYRLLGLEPFENDADVISTAADRQMAHVRTYQNGEHGELSQRLLNELSAARICLLAPEKKKAYDEQLQVELKKEAPGTAVLVVPRNPARTPAPVSIVVPRPVTSPSHRAHRSRGLAWWSMGGAVALSLLVALAFLIHRGGIGGQVADTDTTLTDASERRTAVPDGTVEPMLPGPPTESTLPTVGESDVPVLGASDSSVSASTDASRDNGNAAVPTGIDVGSVRGGEPATPVSLEGDQDGAPPWQVATTTVTPPDPRRGNPQLMDCRAAMFRRDIDSAWKELQQAAPLMTSRSDREDWNDTSMLMTLLESFWRSVETGWDGIKPHQSLNYDGQMVTVDSVTPNGLALRSAAGQLKAFSKGRAALDGRLAVALARAGLASSGPDADRIVGAYYLVDREGDRAIAEQLWNSARQQGVATELLLNAFVVKLNASAAPVSGNEPATPAPALESLLTDDQLVTDKVAAPSAEEQAEAKKLLVETYGASLEAKDDARRVEVAKKLLADSVETRDNRAAQYVMLNTAYDMASSVDATPLMLEILDEAGKQFDVNVADQLREALTKLSRRVNSALIAEDAQLTCNKMVARMVDQDDFKAAAQFTALGVAFSRKSRDPGRLDFATQQQDHIKAMGKEYQKVTDEIQRKKLERTSADAKALMGRYYCLIKGDFVKGLPMLSQSSDEAMRSLAELDLSKPGDPVKMVELGDQWWQTAEGQPSSYRIHSLTRAGYWYQACKDRVTGLTLTRVLQRLKEITDASQDPQISTEYLAHRMMAYHWQIKWKDGRTWDDITFDPNGRWNCVSIGNNVRAYGPWRFEAGRIIAKHQYHPKYEAIFPQNGTIIIHHYNQDKLERIGTIVPMGER